MKEEKHDSVRLVGRSRVANKSEEEEEGARCSGWIL